MKLYYSPGTCSLADHIVLEWIGKPYEAIRVSRDDRKSPEFLRLNPAGAVQVLQDGDWVLTQNMAVRNFLPDILPERSEELRVWKECLSTGTSRRCPDRY